MHSAIAMENNLAAKKQGQSSSRESRLLEQDKWIAKNCFFCPGLRAKITLRTCLSLQKLPRVKGLILPHGCGGGWRPPGCDHCEQKI
ncbi:MAG: hypothetical protein SVS15_01210 [Thermodesulfobacteriota bacterium]|nr:hypothetical protein [Thermodesulfobacteriota bacterium]